MAQEKQKRYKVYLQYKVVEIVAALESCWDTTRYIVISEDDMYGCVYTHGPFAYRAYPGADEKNKDSLVKESFFEPRETLEESICDLLREFGYTLETSDIIEVKPKQKFFSRVE